MSASTLASPTLPQPCRPAPHAAARAWLAVGSIAAGTFATVTTEFLPVGLLTDIGAGLRVSDGTAGLMVTLPGIAAAFAGPGLIVAARRADRRTVMLGLTALLLLSNIVAALAPNFQTMLAARFMLGLCVGGFWAFGPGIGTRLVPAASQARAVSLILAGISIGTVLGVPVGTLVGSVAGWRAAFGGAAALSAALFVAQWWLLPSVPAQRAIGVRELFQPLRKPMVQAGLAVVTLLVVGHFAAYTYLKPLLQQVFGLAPAQVAGLLLVYGLAGFAGNFIGGALVARSLRKTLGGAALGLAVMLMLVPLAGTSGAVAAALVLAWGLAFSAIPVGVTAWMLQAVPEAPEAGQGLLVSVFQVALATGAWVGGLAVDHRGVTSAMLLGGVLAMAAALLVAATAGAGASPRRVME